MLPWDGLARGLSTLLLMPGLPSSHGLRRPCFGSSGLSIWLTHPHLHPQCQSYSANTYGTPATSERGPMQDKEPKSSSQTRSLP